MIWIALAILVVGLFAALPPDIRAGLVAWGLLICGGLLGLAVLAGVALWLKSEHDDNARAKRRALAASKIPLYLIKVEDARLGVDGRFTARVRNNSSDTLQELRLRVIQYDCKSASAPCDVLNRLEPTIFQSVPPRQVRDIDTWISSTPVNVRGRYSWEFDWIGTVASYR